MPAADKKTGFILLHRSIREHWIWNDPEKLRWWIDILMEVNHTGKKVAIGFELIECSRGQSLNSLQTWGKRWLVDISTVRRFFKLLERDKMISTENVKKTTRLTVCNYDDYNGQRHAKQTQSKGEANETQTQDNPNNNGNNGNNSNNGKECEGLHTDNEKNEFNRFNKWQKENAPRVAGMKSPFTIAEFFQFREKYKSTDWKKLLEKMVTTMNNRQSLSGNISAYQTCLNWIKNEKYDEEIISLRDGKPKANNGLPKSIEEYLKEADEYDKAKAKARNSKSADAEQLISSLNAELGSYRSATARSVGSLLSETEFDQNLNQ